MTDQEKDRILNNGFWDKIQKTKNCWLWGGAKNSYGYGHLALYIDKKYIFYMAHRVAFVLSGRKIPNGKILLHACDVPACVNPKHLSVGTQKDNIQDMINKNRGNWSAGEERPMAKFTNKQAENLRKEKKRTGMTNRELADKYKVSNSTVSDIITRKRYRGI